MPPTPQVPARPRRWLLWLRRLILGVLVLLVGADVGLHLAGIHAHMPTFCTWNPRMGCVTKPNLHESLEFFSQHLAFTTNAQGLRNGPIDAKKPGWKRVLVLGDSVTFAPQVPDGAPFANLLDLELFKDQIEVINGGSIFLRATEQELSWFLDVGAALQPDLVVLEFTERNDFADNQHQYWWQPGKNGLERQTDVQPPSYHGWVLRFNETPVVQWLDAHSRLFGLARLGFWNIMHLPRVDTNKRWRESTDDVVARLQQEVAARGGRLAVLVYPSPEHLAGLRGEREWHADNDNARILAIVKAHNIPYLDLTPAMQPATAKVWLDDDGHLTLAGHKAVADLLAPQVRAWLAPTPVK